MQYNTHELIHLYLQHLSTVTAASLCVVKSNVTFLLGPFLCLVLSPRYWVAGAQLFINKVVSILV